MSNYVKDVTLNVKQEIKNNLAYTRQLHVRIISVQNRSDSKLARYAISSKDDKTKIGVIKPGEERYLLVNPHGGAKQTIQVQDYESGENDSKIYPIRSDINVYVLNDQYPWGKYGWSIWNLRNYNRFL